MCKLRLSFCELKQLCISTWENQHLSITKVEVQTQIFVWSDFPDRNNLWADFPDGN